MKTNIFLTAVAVVAASVAFAQTSTPAAPANGANKANWDKNHPRRAQVNSRLNNQNARVDNKVADGKMSQAEANKIHSQDHAIRKEERADAAANHGHITKAEQQHINHQENHVSKEIKNH
jgi:Skp family chaperone for outer membrane proteins